MSPVTYQPRNTNHTEVDTMVPTEAGDCLFKS